MAGSLRERQLLPAMIEFDAGRTGMSQSLPMFDAWASTLGTLSGQKASAPPNWPIAARHVHRIGDESRDSLEAREDQRVVWRASERTMRIVSTRSASAS